MTDYCRIQTIYLHMVACFLNICMFTVCLHVYCMPACLLYVPIFFAHLHVYYTCLHFYSVFAHPLHLTTFLFPCTLQAYFSTPAHSWIHTSCHPHISLLVSSCMHEDTSKDMCGWQDVWIHECAGVLKYACSVHGNKNVVKCNGCANTE